ncbi:MAG: Mce-associated rane protein [Actinomycetota bacterium]|nr:Mce-associated rane protein [Actinomycetota bacterium]
MTVTSAEGDGGGLASAEPRRGPVVLVTVLVLVLILLAVAALLGALKLRDAKQLSDARAAAIGAARQEALNLTSIDGNDIDADLQRVKDGATGGFAKDFADRAKDLKSVLTENAVVAEGHVIDAGLVRGDLDTATVLVVVDSKVKNKSAPSGRANTYRMQLDLERHGSRWLTSALQFVG